MIGFHFKIEDRNGRYWLQLLVPRTGKIAHEFGPFASTGDLTKWVRELLDEVEHSVNELEQLYCEECDGEGWVRIGSLLRGEEECPECGGTGLRPEEKKRKKLRRR